MNNIPTMLTIKETAAKSGIAAHYIRQLCLQNKIVHVKCGRKNLVNYEKFVEFLNIGDTLAPVVGGIRRVM